MCIRDRNGTVEDPVGPSMFDEEGTGHRGAQELSEFWDKTVGTTEKIDFEFDEEIICGSEVAYIGKIVTHIGGHISESRGVFTYRVDEEAAAAARAAREQGQAAGTSSDAPEAQPTQGAERPDA